MLLLVFKDNSSLFISLLSEISGLFVCKISKQESLILLMATTMILNLRYSARKPQKMNLVIWDLNQTRDISNGLV